MKFRHEFAGPANFRNRIALSLITAHPIKIKKIRHKASDPGLTKSENSFLKLVDKISNGTCITINETGTEVIFMPGSIIGGKINHNKFPLDVTFMGVTNNQTDPSIDLIQNNWVPLLKKFLGAASAYKFKVEMSVRGLPPNGGGIVKYYFHPITKILPIQLTNTGKILKIRGIAWSCLVDKTLPLQLIKGAKDILNKFLSDVYIISSPQTAETAGKSPGYGITIWAESKEGAIYSGEAMSSPKRVEEKDVVNEIDVSIPSEIGVLAAHRLLDQIYKNGFVDDSAQSVFLNFMALEGCRNVSQLSIGSPTPYTVENIKIILSYLGVKFNLQYLSEVDLAQNNVFKLEKNAVLAKSNTTTGAIPLLATCFGCGLQNYNKEIL